MSIGLSEKGDPRGLLGFFDWVARRVATYTIFVWMLVRIAEGSQFGGIVVDYIDFF